MWLLLKKALELSFQFAEIGTLKMNHVKNAITSFTMAMCRVLAFIVLGLFILLVLSPSLVLQSFASWLTRALSVIFRGALKLED